MPTRQGRSRKKLVLKILAVVAVATILRAEAMTIRDSKAEVGGVSETDWRKIEELLHQYWRSLSSAVKTNLAQSQGRIERR